MSESDPSNTSPDAAHDISTGLERVLLRARREPAFLEQLEQRRSRAAREAGIELSATETALLDTIEPAAMAQMVASLPRSARGSAHGAVQYAAHGIRPSLADQGDVRERFVPEFERIRGSRAGVKVAVATGVVLAAGAGALLCVTAGNRPDVPPPAAGRDAEPEDGSRDGSTD